MLPVNFKTYYMDLEKANNGQPEWKLLHDFTNYYGMEDLSPDSISGFANRVKQDESLAMLYRWNMGRQVPYDKPTSCDAGCRTDLFCEITTSEQFQNKDCNGLP